MNINYVVEWIVIYFNYSDNLYEYMDWNMCCLWCHIFVMIFIAYLWQFIVENIEKMLLKFWLYGGTHVGGILTIHMKEVSWTNF